MGSIPMVGSNFDGHPHRPHADRARAVLTAGKLRVRTVEGPERMLVGLEGFDDMGSRTDRIAISLACTVCSARNYKASRARRPDARPIELKKFCRGCGAHTLHVETK